MSMYPGIDLAATHLNAPVGQVLSAAQLVAALRAGSLDALAYAPEAAALVSYLFVELEPQLIARCGREAGCDLRSVNHLYRDTLARALPRVAAWERATEHLV